MQMTNAVVVHPHRCEFCTSNQAPFIDTEIPRPSGGYFHVCSTCWRQFCMVLGVVAKSDLEAVQAQLVAAQEQVAPLDAVRAELATVAAERDNALASEAHLRAENQTLTNENARLERDNADLRDGHQMARSEVPAATASIVADTLDELARRAAEKKTPTRKQKPSTLMPREAT